MSSTYQILCLSHDPAIQLERGYNTPESAIAVARNPGEHGLDDHASCDLLVGQYSYPLVEVACPGHEGLGDDGHDNHHEPRWIVVEELRLLLAIQRLPPSDGHLNITVSGSQSGCWTTQRLDRLRSEL